MQNNPSQNQETVTVCGGRIKDPACYPSALYKGKHVYFCTRACLRAYEANPDHFMAGEIEHPVEEE